MNDRCRCGEMSIGFSGLLSSVVSQIGLNEADSQIVVRLVELLPCENADQTTSAIRWFRAGGGLK